MKYWQQAVLGGLLCASCSAKPASETPSDPTPGDAKSVTPKPAETGWKAKLPSVTKLAYHYQDSSVPPQYHRSITITVTSNEIEKVVDSYGDIIEQHSNAITAEQFQGLLATLDELGIDVKKSGAEPEAGCTGGTSDSLSLWAGPSEVFSARSSSCGGGRSGELLGDIKQVARNATALLLKNTDGPKPSAVSE